MTDHPYKTAPLAHQRAAFDAHGLDRGYGLFWEQGVGKTKPTIDVAAAHWLARRIDGLLVVAPKGVDRNWTSDEIPAHMPKEVNHLAYLFRSAAADTRAHEQACKLLLNYDGLAVLVLGYEAFRTDEGKRLAKAFLVRRRTMMVLDESQRIKTPKAKRSMTVLAAGKYAAYRWILSGTPVTKKPLDVYNQVKFLDDDFWKRHDIGSFTAMRARFEITKPIGAPGRMINIVVGYRDPEVIRDWIKPLCSRLLKKDCLDLPPKIYAKRYFQMSPRQAAAYSQLRATYQAMVEDQGRWKEVTAILPLVRLTRYQQIACGYVADPDDAGEDSPRMIDLEPGAENARINCLLDELESIQESEPGAKVIIWYKYRRDGDLILAALGDHAVRYDGSVPDKARPAAIARFRDPDGARYFCANPATIGMGITLNEAHDVVYYDNSFVAEHRWQSEDRCHRVGQTHPVRYCDLVAEDTVDRRVVEVLRANRDLASAVLGDDPGDWI